MPYRIDVDAAPAAAVETLIDLGALDVESAGDMVTALMPDAVPAATVACALGVPDLRVSAAVGRDDGSVWLLAPRPARVGAFLLVPDAVDAPADAIVLADGPAFGTGLHPTTALCLQAIEEHLSVAAPARMLDVGTGSGVLGLAALRRGVSRVVGLDLDPEALRVAAVNARLNGVALRLALVRGGPEAVRGTWPLVVANIRAAELMAMAPVLVRRVAGAGRLVLSGIPNAVAGDVERTYRRFGMRPIRVETSGSWSALVLHASW